jgi:hypothetical protein
VIIVGDNEFSKDACRIYYALYSLFVKQNNKNNTPDLEILELSVTLFYR